MNSGLWSNLLRRTAITTTFYFAAEEESVGKREKYWNINWTSHDLDASFLKQSQWFSYGKDSLTAFETDLRDKVCSREFKQIHNHFDTLQSRIWRNKKKVYKYICFRWKKQLVKNKCQPIDIKLYLQPKHSRSKSQKPKLKLTEKRKNFQNV